MTTPNTPAKKVVSVEILHLDETGYGPEGKHTRRAWRAECLENFEAGAEAFLAWQKFWQHLAKQNKLEADFEVLRTFDDQSQDEISLYGLYSPSHCLDFAGHLFINYVYAEGYQFLYDANFHKSIFTDYADFREATFTGTASFGQTTFTDYTSFSQSTFTSGASFSLSTFTDNADFSETTFIEGGLFYKTIFTDDAKFNESTFTDSAFFWESTFNRNAGFSKAIFIGNADFSAVNFEEHADFLKAKFHNQISFRDANFKGETDFESTEFANVGHFEGAEFIGKNAKAPSFRGVNIGNTRLEFSNDKHFTQADFSEEAIKNISFLKLLSEQHGQIDQALNFNAMELRAKRLQALELLEVKGLNWLESFLICTYSGTWWEMCPMTWLYGKVSDFGRSFMRPLAGFVAIYMLLPKNQTTL